MTILIKFILALGLVLGVYGYINYSDSRYEKNIYCQMTYMWVEYQDEAQTSRPGWPPFDSTIKCNNGEAVS